MKLKNNFFIGLSSGLLIGFLIFNVSLSTSNAESDPSIATAPTAVAEVDSVRGGFISPSEAQGLHDAYVNEFLGRKGMPNTSLGGTIGHKNLRDLIGIMGDGDLSFRFYHTTSEEGYDQIGVLFYPEKAEENVLRTGPGSFCPSLCN